MLPAAEHKAAALKLPTLLWKADSDDKSKPVLLLGGARSLFLKSSVLPEQLL